MEEAHSKLSRVMGGETRQNVKLPHTNMKTCPKLEVICDILLGVDMWVLIDLICTNEPMCI